MISELVPAPVPPAQRWGPLMLVGDARWGVQA